MTKEEFKEQYKFYINKSAGLAWKDARNINNTNPVENDLVIVRPSLGQYVLVLQSEYLKELK
jgi:hypothetical protein